MLVLVIAGSCVSVFFISINRISGTTGTYVEEVVADEQYFKIIKTGVQKYSYYVYDADGNTVEKQVGVTNLSDIKLLDNNVVDIDVDWGTGLAEHQYYSVDKNSFSEKYYYVIAYSNEKVAYLDGPLDNRHLIVENVFDKYEYHNEFDLDCSTFDQPVTDACFINNDLQLQITYFSGENETERTDILDLY